MLGGLKGLADGAKKGLEKAHSDLTGKDKKASKKTRGNTTVGHGVLPEENSPAFASRAAECIPGTIKMFSGCKDEQTSADVSNVASFGLPPVNDSEKAGGACTNALLGTLERMGHQPTWAELLTEMQKLLKQRKYTQVPQLSASHQVNMKEEKFSVVNPEPSGRFRALLVGINYYGQKGELAGCVNDVRMMKRYLMTQGYKESDIRVLVDDPNEPGNYGMPTFDNIVDGLDWLTDDAAKGDSLFLHYSGHGGQIPDDNGDELDGLDETLIPVDYGKKGQIRDDYIYKILVAHVPAGCTLICCMDCCHSGTVLDLPYTFAASDAGCAALGGGHPFLSANPLFNFDYALQVAQEIGRAIVGGITRGLRVAEMKARALAK